MKDTFTTCNQLVDNDTSMTTPAHRFRAHNGAALLPSQFDQLRQAMTKRLAQSAIGIVMKTLIMSKTVYFGLNILALAA